MRRTIIRRDFVQATSTLALSGVNKANPRQPVIFVSHGPPSLALDTDKGRTFEGWRMVSRGRGGYLWCPRTGPVPR